MTTQPAPENPGNDKAVVGAEVQYYVVSAGLIIVGVLGGLWLQHGNHADLTKLPPLAAGVSVFAVLYIFAQVIERLLEPVSPWLGGVLGVHGSQTTKNILLKKRENAIRYAVRTEDSEAPKQVTDAQRKVDQFRANASTLSVGLAAFLAMIGCGYTGALMLHLIGLTDVVTWVDILVTGLAVGGGTKPLHDLISNIKTSKETKQDEQAVQAALR